jgi:hypothetical protein
MLYNSLKSSGGGMKKQKTLKANSSGQLLLIAALAIAMLISSTTIYVYEVSKETNNQEHSPISKSVLAIKQGTRNAMISALANASNQGETTILATNLNKLSQVLQSLNHFGTCYLASTQLNNSDYEEGIRLSWNTSDWGISSAYSNFTLRIYSIAENVTLNYDVNITTAVTINGYYTRLVGDEKQVNLTLNVYNEEETALVRNSTFLYGSLGSWIPANSSNNLSITDYGNGTYHIAFTISVPSDPIQVSVQIQDMRNIFVSANTTCYEA